MEDALSIIILLLFAYILAIYEDKYDLWRHKRKNKK